MGGRLNQVEHRAMMNTPLYRIYHIGVEEIRHRLTADQRNRTKCFPRARSRRSAPASTAVWCARRSGSTAQMVLLTIAISGGPFLGLLGTVVGVMITFAAIAAAGDVNVNAIAPGIAAALLATVAGLGVAIPALFGYNYLLTRIKDVTSDMHVFIDEFVTKMAEFYSEPGGSQPSRTDAIRHASPGEDKPYDDINITPMLDLAYVLLVIFILMCTASVQGMKVNLPKASTAAACETEDQGDHDQQRGQILPRYHPRHAGGTGATAEPAEGADAGFPRGDPRRQPDAIPGGDGCARRGGPPRHHPGRSRHQTCRKIAATNQHGSARSV